MLSLIKSLRVWFSIYDYRNAVHAVFVNRKNIIPTPIRPKNKFKIMPRIGNSFLVFFENAPIKPKINPVKCSSGASKPTTKKAMENVSLKDLLKSFPTVFSTLSLVKTTDKTIRSVTISGKQPPMTVEAMPSRECRLGKSRSSICLIFFQPIASRFILVKVILSETQV